MNYRLLLLLFISPFLAGCQPQTSPAQDIQRQHSGPWEKDIGYTQVVQIDKMLYLSGIVSGGPTMADQVESIYDHIQSILENYGADTSRIVKEVIFTTDMEALKTTIELRKSYYPSGLYPSATWVEIDRLFMEEALLEVEIQVLLP